MTEFDVIVVGAGLVGAAVAYDLRRAGYDVLVLEREQELGAGVSRSNSGVLHTGFDSPPGTFETQMIRDQAGRWPHIFDELKIPYRVPGALLLAHTDDEAAQLADLAQKAALNGVQTKILDERATRAAEPHSHARASLHIPSEAITDPYEVVTRLLHGIEVRLGWKVESTETAEDGVRVWGPQGSLTARFVVNCAGLFADELGEEGFSITPRRGEFVVFGEGTARLIQHILLPVPNAFTKGVLVFPTLYGYLCAGPTAVDQHDKSDWTPHLSALPALHQKASEVLPILEGERVEDAWAGLRPVGQPHNYICEFSSRVPRLLHLAGIRSTGLSSCLGLSAWALTQLIEHGLPVKAPGNAPEPPPSRSGTPWWQRLNRFREVPALVSRP
ncbi:FAD-dependent oxidoreductase [Deinococcus sp. Arct2-2]|uniref:NAD(P)/FAD-dependent oxidoreductase n=1 Tax=Deinococcus sp. Arct2-2 TaxID=2568653 RepID=UPI0010A2B647|nr:FAD-dependent oxidoreductase [Deinococcus sp. Arct2-2]THF70827.1 FAD-dependent oxidoreductase [Deinococcus sp. Arct2-2]